MCEIVAQFSLVKRCEHVANLRTRNNLEGNPYRIWRTFLVTRHTLEARECVSIVLLRWSTGRGA